MENGTLKAESSLEQEQSLWQFILSYLQFFQIDKREVDHYRQNEGAHLMPSGIQLPDTTSAYMRYNK